MTTDHQRRQWRESKHRQRAGNAATQRGPQPVYGETMRRYQVTMPDAMADHARTVGGGNLSAGIRAVCAAHAALAMAEHDGQDTTEHRAAVMAAERALRAGKQKETAPCWVAHEDGQLTDATGAHITYCIDYSAADYLAREYNALRSK